MTETRSPIVVVSPLPPHLEPLVSLIAEAGCEVRRVPGDASFGWVADTISEYLATADAAVGIFRSAPLTRAALEGALRLRVVTSPIIGTETIDVKACSDLGIVVGFGATPENYLGVAEAAVMLIAAMRKQLVPKMTAAVDGTWRPATGVGNMVRGTVVGLVGYGAIGRATAARLSGWDCQILAHDPYQPVDTIKGDHVEPVELDELLTRADVVSLAVTLTEETRGLIGRREIELMKPSAYLINTARGGLVDEVALRDALDGGGLAGAAIDTWEEEGPASSSPLRGHPLVIATGHNVGHSHELYDGHPLAARDNTVLALRGKIPLYVRNPDVLPDWSARIERLNLEYPLTLEPTESMELT